MPRLERDGHDVMMASGDGPFVEEIEAAGFRYHVLPVERSGMNPWSELRALASLVRLYRHVRPDVTHHFTMKGVLYGSTVAHLAGLPAFVNSVMGMGYGFGRDGLRARLLWAAMWQRHRLAFRGAQVIFQNPDDRRVFERAKVMGAAPHTLIRGSGVDTDTFSPAPFVDKKAPLVVFCGRMVWQKGAGTFVEAARQFDAEAARFVLVGDTDPDNPDAIPAGQLRAWEQGEAVEWWGYRDDMPSVLARADIVAFPSASARECPRCSSRPPPAPAPS